MIIICGDIKCELCLIGYFICRVAHEISLHENNLHHLHDNDHFTFSCYITF